jgi:hypothetical protein
MTGFLKPNNKVRQHSKIGNFCLGYMANALRLSCFSCSHDKQQKWQGQPNHYQCKGMLSAQDFVYRVNRKSDDNTTTIKVQGLGHTASIRHLPSCIRLAGQIASPNSIPPAHAQAFRNAMPATRWPPAGRRHAPYEGAALAAN